MADSPLSADSQPNPLENSTNESRPIPGLPENWHQLATDKIISTVNQVKVKSSGPAVGIARRTVFGVLALLLAAMAVPVFLVGLVRLLDEAIPRGVWLVYLILGAFFVLLGLFLWSKRPRGIAS